MSIDVSRLQVSLEEGERWRRTLSITIPSDVLQEERRSTMKKLASRIKLPGFREGKVPAAVMEKRFGSAVNQELLDRVIGEAYRGVLQDRNLQPISEGEVGEVDFQPEADLSFEISFDVAPVVELARLSGFKVERPVVPVGDAEVNQVLDRIREQEGSWAPAEEGAPVEGDRVKVRIERLEEKDEEPRAYEFVIGKGEAIPEIESAIGTLVAGESGEFTIPVPATEQGAGEGAAGERRLRIHLDAREVRELPELSDELAKAAGEFETLDELRTHIREDLEKEAKREGEARLRGGLLEQVLAANPFDIPESMIDQYVKATIGNHGDIPDDRFAEAKEQLRPHAVQTVQRFIVISRIAESKGLKATEEDIDARIEEIAEKNEKDPGEIYAHLQKSGQLEDLEREITETRVFDFLKGESTIVEPA
jgi:trigger factor